MKTHPATLMLRTWILCWAAFLILPYQLLDKQLSAYGIAVFLLFLGAFLLGAWLVPMGEAPPPDKEYPPIDAEAAEWWLKLASLIAIVGFLFDIKSKSVFDLAATYALRSDSANALLLGEASNSSAGFQIAFLTYPASYIYIVVHMIYAPRIRFWRLAFFGFLPSLLGSLSMGGRAALFYAMLAAFLSLSVRKSYLGPRRLAQMRRRPPVVRLLIGAAVLLGVIAATYYFSAVFLVRADTAGGVSGMFDVAEQNWGIGFHGPLSGFMFRVLGDSLTYLVFIFFWYLLQGLLMSNVLFTSYTGPAQMGIYGVDLVSALMRRVNGELVSKGFDSLQQLGTYGFLPSAFGSLYVDYKFFGLIPCVIWGYLASIVYRNIRRKDDARWLIAGPFVTMGIFFSLINTPIGFSNGFVTYLWLIFAFRRLKRPGVEKVSPGSVFADELPSHA